MSVIGKTKSSGYAAAGLGFGAAEGLVGAKAVGKIGFNEISTMLDGGARGLEEISARVYDQDVDDYTEIDNSDGSLNNIASSMAYTVAAGALLYGASKSFGNAKANW